MSVCRHYHETLLGNNYRRQQQQKKSTLYFGDHSYRFSLSRGSAAQQSGRNCDILVYILVQRFCICWLFSTSPSPLIFCLFSIFSFWYYCISGGYSHIACNSVYFKAEAFILFIRSLDMHRINSDVLFYYRMISVGGKNNHFWNFCFHRLCR